MPYIDKLYALMEEKLSTDQLETLLDYINEQPYKRQHRPPTLAEQEVVIAAIENALLDAHGQDDSNDGLRRLMESGDIGHLPDVDF